MARFLKLENQELPNQEVSMSKEAPRKEVDPKNWIHTNVIRLKDGEHSRGVMIDLFRTFGFSPRFICITKVESQSNRFIVSAEKTPEMIALQNKALEQIAAERKAEEAKVPDKTAV